MAERTALRNLERELRHGRVTRRDFLRRAVALGVSAPAVAASLAACGGSAATPTGAPAAPAAPATSTPPAAPTAARTSSATAAASPPAAAAGATGYPSGGKYSTLEAVGRKGGHIVEIASSDARTTNPMLSGDGSSGARIALMFNALVQTNPDTGLPFPDLATEVPTRENGGISADGLTYTFKLRRGVAWHDGQPCTARDAVYTYQTMANKDLGSPNTSLVNERIAAVAAPDDFTVVFTLKKVVAPFLSNNMYYLVPEHILKEVPVAQIKQHPFSTGDPKATIGTGPFKFQDWLKDDHATLVKHPAYFRGEPALDQYVFKVVKDSTVVASQLKTGEADYASPAAGITAIFYDDLVKQPNLTVARYDLTQGTFVSFQLDPARSTLFGDKRVRQALAYGLNREAMIQAIDNGLATVAQGTIPPISWAYAPDQITPQYTYDPQRAEQLLDEAGWTKGQDGVRAKGGQRLAFTLWTFAGNKIREQQVTAMQQQWKGLGVDATVKTEEWNAFLARLNETHDFEANLVAYGVGLDPDQTNFFACDAYTSGYNVGRYCNPRVDELFARGLSELDQAKRKQLYVELQNVLWDDLPTLVLEYAQGIDAINKRVHNMRSNTVNFRWNAHTWWVEDGK